MSEPITVLLRRLDPREQVIAVPHYIERIAAGVMHVAPGVLTATESAAVYQRRQVIEALRRHRQQALEARPPRQHSAAVIWRGIRVVATWTVAVRAGHSSIGWSAHGPLHGHEKTRRQAVRVMLRYRRRRYGHYDLWRSYGGLPWALQADYITIATWPRRPTRDAIASAIRAHRATRPSRRAPDTLGWRAWTWDARRRCLLSPHQNTPWTDHVLSAETWSVDAAVRGEAGIHARRMPMDVRRAKWSEAGHQEGPRADGALVHGVVERWGRFVLGTTGWRAEHVVIRELVAPSNEIADALRQTYPTVTVHVGGCHENR